MILSIYLYPVLVMHFPPLHITTTTLFFNFVSVEMSDTLFEFYLMCAGPTYFSSAIMSTEVSFLSKFVSSFSVLR